MNISLENVDKVSACLTLKLEKADYEGEVKKLLRTFCQKAQVHGFRPGKLPMSVAIKMYGSQAKAEAVDHMVSEKLSAYLTENKVQLLGQPMVSDKQPIIDFEKQDDFEFLFDIALKPEFTVEATADDHIPYYDIEVSDEMVNKQVDDYAQRGGHSVSVDEYADKDIVRGTLAELDENGQPKEGGLVVEKASLMPSYFKNDEQKKVFDGVKKNTVVTLNLSKAYDGNEAEVASLLKVKKEEAGAYTGDFSFQIDEISRYMPAEVGQELFDQVFGEGQVKSEEEFRAKIKEAIAANMAHNSDYKFLVDARAHFEEKVGELAFSEPLLKKFLQNSHRSEKSEPMSPEELDKAYENNIKSLKWELIKDKFANQLHIEIKQEEVKATAVGAARMQFAQYGMMNVPEQYIEQYAADMMKKEENVRYYFDACLNSKLTAALKETVTLDRQTVSMEDFNKMFE